MKISFFMKMPQIFILLITLSISIIDQNFAYAQNSAKPNIILILVDDMGYSDLGYFGSEINTPNIDKLAKNGLTFTNFTNCAKCETTRTTLMTGRYHIESKGNASNSITIPENLGLAGYQNFMVGKWHIFGTPTTRGFDRYFGFLEGAVNFFTGEGTKGGTSFRIDDKPYEVPKKDFYTTTVFTDYALKFIQERDKEKPFFLYLAHNAPHYPLMAPKEEIMKYRGKYKAGWAELRKARYTKMKELGIIPSDMDLTDPEPDVRDWDSLSEEEKDRQELLMATYAAMIDMVDQSVGQVVNTLENENILENTLILFLSDNGACPFDRTRAQTLENNYMPWEGRSYYCYTKEWANACNTPFRKYKQNQNEGGISTPMIAHWPVGIKNPGRFDRERAHLVDFHATFRELASVEYPKEFQGNKLGEARGLSLVNAFKNEPRENHKELYYTFGNKYSALLQGDFKVVDQKYLYNLKSDRTEANDLSKKMPEKFGQMTARWKELTKKLSASPSSKKKKK